MPTLTDRFSGIDPLEVVYPNGSYDELRAGATTKQDVGLGSVRDVASYSQAEADVAFAPMAHSHDYLPLAGGDVAGKLQVTLNTVDAAYNTGHVELRTLDGSDVSMGFHRSGFTACQLRHSANGLILSGTARTSAADFYAYGNITAYSDARLKLNVVRIEGALDKVSALSGYTFEKTNEEGQDRRRHIGVIAQEVNSVVPEAVHLGSDGYYSVAYGNLVGLLIEAIKEERQAREALERRIETLEG